MGSSDSDSDTDWNEELFRAISKSSGMGPEISELERCREIQRCIDQGADVNYSDKHGDTAMHKAVKKGYVEVVKFLRGSKQKARIDILNKKGLTALTLAEKLGKTQIFEYLKAAIQPGASMALVDHQIPSTSGTNVFRNGTSNNSSPFARNLKRPLDTGNDRNKNSKKKRVTIAKPAYAQGGLTSSFHGNMYQLKHYMLILQRASKLGYSFHLAKEMDVADKLDDLVFEYRRDANSTELIHRFLQFKHQGEETARTDKIGSSALLNVDEGNFSLLKYFMSYRKINKRPEFSKSSFKDLILCTNVDLNVVDLQRVNIDVEQIRDRDDFLTVTTSLRDKNPKCYKLKVKDGHELFNILKTASDVHCLAKALAKNVETNTPEKLTLASAIFKQYHTSLSKEVVDIKQRRFKENFVNPAKYDKLSKKAQHLRDAFFQHVKELRAMKNIPDKDIWERLQKIFKFNLSGTFGVGRVTELPDDSISDDEIKKFFKEFIIAVDQPDEKQLTDVIGDEFAEKFNLLNADFPVDFLQTAIVNWFKEAGPLGRYLTDIHADEFFDEIQERLSTLITVGLSLEYLEELKNYDIKFKEANTKLQEFLESSSASGLLLTSSDETLLLALSVQQTVARIMEYQMDDSYVLIKLEKLRLPNVFSHVLRAFGSSRSHRLLIIDCAANCEELYEHDAWNSLLDIAAQNPRKKLVVINQKRNDSATSNEEYDDMNFVHLDGVSQRKLLDRSVKFQGQGDVRLGTLLGVGAFDDVGEDELKDLSRIIDVGTLIKLIRNETIEIGSKVKGLDEIEGYYITRTILHLIDEEERLVKEDEFFNNAEQSSVTILSDTAGMGKSTILTKFATELKRDSSLLVIRIDLSSPQATRALASEKLEDEEDEEEEERNSIDKIDEDIGAVDFLIDKLFSTKNDLESRVFRRLLSISNRSALLFDGFDEICPTYKDKVLDLLQALKTEAIFKKLVITTRPHASENLADKLGASSYYTLRPFSVDDQRNFLIKFWKMELRAAGLDEPIEIKLLEDHARNVISLLAESINDRMKEFTGIPLQTRMVAEVYSVVKGKKKKHFLIPTLPKIINIIKLYRDFVSKRYDIYFEEKNHGDPSNPGQKKGDNMTREVFDAAHQKLALDALFDEEISKGLHLSQPNVKAYFYLWQRQHEGGECTGIIIQIVDGKPLFIHRTFAEFFAAQFMFETLKDDGGNEHLRTFFLSNIFVDPDYKVVRAFLNCLFLAKSNEPRTEPWKLDLRENCNESGQTVYHIAAQERCVGTVRFFLNCLSPHGADQTSQNALTEFDNQTEARATTSDDTGSLMELENEEPIVTFRDDLSITDNRGRTPLHIAVETEDNFEVIKCIVDGGADINAHNIFGETQLHEASWLGDIDAMKYLVKKGADVNEQMLHGRTPLHFASSRASCDLDVLAFLIEKGGKINPLVEDGTTLLHEASKAGNLKVIEYLLNNGADINERTTTGLTALHFAVANTHGDLNVVEFLIKKGADTKFVANDGTTPLHEASKAGNLGVMEYLCNNYSADINARTTPRGITPLHCAAASKGDNLKAVKFLIKKGADINSLAYDGTTLLHEASSADNLNIVIYLLEEGADVDAQMTCGQTPLHRVASNCCIDSTVLEYLIAEGADMNLRNNEGFTPLHSAVDQLFKSYIIESNVASENVLFRLQLSVIKMLLNEGADPNIRDNYGRTPKDLAILQTGDADVLQDLFEAKLWYVLGHALRYSFASRTGFAVTFTKDPTGTKIRGSMVFQNLGSFLLSTWTSAFLCISSYNLILNHILQ